MTILMNGNNSNKNNLNKAQTEQKKYRQTGD